MKTKNMNSKLRKLGNTYYAGIVRLSGENWRGERKTATVSLGQTTSGLWLLREFCRQVGEIDHRTFAVTMSK